MQIDKTILAGGAGVMLGRLLAFAFGATGRGKLDAAIERQDELSKSMAALSDSVGAIDGRIGGIEGAIKDRVGGLEGTIVGLSESYSGDLKGLADKFEGLGSQLAGTVSGLGSEVSTTLSADLEKLRASVASLVAGTAKSDAGGTPSATAGVSGDGEKLQIGATTAFDDGATRVFLATADQKRGVARVAINGPATTTLDLGKPVNVGDCTFTLTGFLPRGATVSGGCGGGSGGKLAATGSGLGTHVAVGSAASLGDAGVRVFVSSIDPTNNAARVAINGTALTLMNLADPVSLDGCNLELTGIGDGTATLNTDC
jgi:hypothetical protein